MTMAVMNLFFCDNGTGMSKEFQEKLFEPFGRAEDSRVSKIEGTGLGMTIARNIARRREEVTGIDYARKEDFKWISVIRLPDFVAREDFEWAITEATGEKGCSGEAEDGDPASDQTCRGVMSYAFCRRKGYPDREERFLWDEYLSWLYAWVYLL